MMVAAVVNATVTEPWATRTTAATMIGRPRASSESATASPMPLARSTTPNMPPAPVIRMIEQTGPSAESTTVSTRVLSLFCL
jgi:hypothetical protein